METEWTGGGDKVSKSKEIRVDIGDQLQLTAIFMDTPGSILFRTVELLSK